MTETFAGLPEPWATIALVATFVFGAACWVGVLAMRDYVERKDCMSDVEE